MPNSFRVGDTVTIREWDDMLEEYDYNSRRDAITIPFSFTHHMKKYCGKLATITSIGVSAARKTEIYDLEFKGSTHPAEFYFGHDMFKENKLKFGNKFNEFRGKVKKENERRFDEALI